MWYNKSIYSVFLFSGELYPGVLLSGKGFDTFFGMILYIFFIIFLNISYEVYVLMIKWKVVGMPIISWYD